VPILVDGNNLLHTLPGGLRRRDEVRRLTLELVRREATRVVVVFDGPPPAGSPAREMLGRLTIVYSGTRSADDVIMASVPSGTGARQWVVITDDLGLRTRARERGAEVRSVGTWRAKLLGGRGSRSGAKGKPKPAAGREAKLSSREVADWKRFFSGRRGENAAPSAGSRVTTSSARRKKE
jgi:hypothetical protein